MAARSIDNGTAYEKTMTAWSDQRPRSDRGRYALGRRVLIRSREAWMLAAILFVGAGIRIYSAGAHIFEQDELWSIIEARDLFATTLEPGIDARPLYYLLQHVIQDLVGTGPWAMRGLPLVLGVLGIAATWVLARRLFGPLSAGLVATVVSLSPWHIHASAMARYWSMVYLLAVLFLMSLLRAYRSNRPSDYAVTLVALLLGSATHPTFLFPVCGVLLGISLVRRDGTLGLRLPTREAWFYLYFPFIVALAATVATFQLLGRDDPMQNFSGRGTLALLRLVPAVVEWATPIAVTGATMGAVLLVVRGRQWRGRAWGMMAVGGVTMSVLLLTIAGTRTNVYADYATAALPLVFVSLGALSSQVERRLTSGRRLFGFGATVIILAGMAPSTVSEIHTGTRFDYRPAFERIRATAPDVMVLTWPLVVMNHYAPDLRGGAVDVSLPRIQAQLEAEGELWIVTSVRRYGIVEDDSGTLAHWLARNCQWVESFERPRFDYRVYRVELHRCFGPAARANDRDGEIAIL